MLGFLRLFTLRVQLILFVVSLIAAVALTITSGLTWSWIFYLILIILITKYILIGTVNGAAMSLQSQQIDKAERLLSYTKFPQWLRFGYQGIFYFLKSIIAMQRKDFKASEEYTHKALAIGLPSDENEALAYINLAGIYANQRRIREAKDYVQRAKKLKVTEPMIKEQIKQIDDALHGRNQSMQKQKGRRGRSRGAGGARWF